MRSIVGHMQRWVLGVGMMAAAPLAWSAMDATAQEPTPAELSTMGERERALRQDLQNILTELDDIQRSKDAKPGKSADAATPAVTKTVEPTTPEESPEYDLADISIISKRQLKRPEGVALSATPRSEADSQPTRHLRESMESLPGVVVRQANGVRDFNISIRGSGAKNAFGVRNLKMYEDGIQQTQSDGLSRLDIHDPWFMESVEVMRGPSSSLYGNYALGGMVQFKTRRGKDIDGVELFLSGGSYGYFKSALAVGKDYGNVDIALFASHQREDGFLEWSDYDTSTVNLNIRFRIDDKQSFYFKAINNEMDSKFPTRLTQAQFNSVPRQQGGTATTNPTTLHSKRRDRRTIVGGMYERQIDANTLLQVEGDYDVKDINQPVSTNINPNFKHYTNLIHDGRLGTMPLRSMLGFFVDYMEQEGGSYRNQNDGHATFGPLQQQTRLTQRNIGARFREELEFIPKWTLAVGMGYENSLISGIVTNYNTTATVSTFTNRVGVNRSFDNFAPEASLTFRPNERMRVWTRASTGYAIPGFGNLTTGVDGNPGLNLDLKPQKNFAAEIGTEGWVTKTFNVQVVGFWTFFKNEIIQQSVPLSATTAGSFAVNAEESQYRGVEIGWRWVPETLPGFTLAGAYTHIDSKYVKFTDQFVIGGVTNRINQAGHNVPAVERNVFNSKASYEHGPTGLGAWFEGSWVDSFFINNNNTIGSPAYMLFNLNLHHHWPIHNNKYIRFVKTFFEIDNLANKTYAASAVPVADSTPDASKQAFFAGYGRSFYIGMTLGLF